MSNLRLIGLIIGLFGLLLTFKVYRGPRWKRLNFVLFGIFSISIITISVNPNVINGIVGMLAMREAYMGRIIVLLIFSNIGIWLFFFYHKTSFDEQKYQFDLLIRNMGHEEVKSALTDKIANTRIVVIIPAYNEAENLKILLSRIPSHIKGIKVGVLVVDDGSSDDTCQVAIDAGCFLVRNRINRGQGAASRLGYDVLLHDNVEVGVTMDADGQHNPDEMEKIVGPILEDRCDLVIGSRVLGSAHKTSKLRSIGVSFLTKIVNMLTGLTLTDCSSGFKAFKMEKMKKLRLSEDQFQSAEVLIDAAKKGLRIGEESVTIVKRQCGWSKKGKDLSYGTNFAKVIIKTWWR